jgi:hypothetical protein
VDEVPDLRALGPRLGQVLVALVLGPVTAFVVLSLAPRKGGGLAFAVLPIFVVLGAALAFGYTVVFEWARRRFLPVPMRRLPSLLPVARVLTARRAPTRYRSSRR